MAITHLTKEIGNIVIAALRTMFEDNAEYPYSDDVTKTGLVITAALPTLDVENKLPHLVVADSRYNFSQQFIGQNLEKTRVVEGKGVQYIFSSIVPFSVQIHCLSANKNEAELLGDIVAEQISFLSNNILSALGLYIDAVEAGSSAMKSQYPQFEFSCGVNMRGRLKYTWTVTNPDETTIINKITLRISNS